MSSKDVVFKHYADNVVVWDAYRALSKLDRHFKVTKRELPGISEQVEKLKILKDEMEEAYSKAVQQFKKENHELS